MLAGERGPSLACVVEDGVAEQRVRRILLFVPHGHVLVSRPPERGCPWKAASGTRFPVPPDAPTQAVAGYRHPLRSVAPPARRLLVVAQTDVPDAVLRAVAPRETALGRHRHAVRPEAPAPIAVTAHPRGGPRRRHRRQPLLHLGLGVGPQQPVLPPRRTFEGDADLAGGQFVHLDDLMHLLERHARLR